MRRDERWWVMGALAMAAGCGGEPATSTAMVVESLSLSGTVDGEPVDGAGYSTGDGTLVGDTGIFFVPGREGWLEVAACPIGATPLETSDVNPYDALSGIPTTDPGCAPHLQLCGPNGCVSFGPEDLTFEVMDDDRSRLLSLDARGLPGDVHLEMRFRTSTASDSTSERRP